MMKSLKQKTMSGIVWSSLERFSVQGIQFIINFFNIIFFFYFYFYHNYFTVIDLITNFVYG